MIIININFNDLIKNFFRSKEKRKEKDNFFLLINLSVYEYYNEIESLKQNSKKQNTRERKREKKNPYRLS